jgi:hypothetical protein
VRGQHGTRYADLTQEPLFPFGHGLSYTTYRYSNARLASPTLARGQAATVSVDVENAGSRAGDEIVQVYVSDVVTSVTWVGKSLQGFSRVPLAPGERKTVTVTLPWEAFQLVDADGRRVVEPGEFHVLVGPSSRDRDLRRPACGGVPRRARPERRHRERQVQPLPWPPSPQAASPSFRGGYRRQRRDAALRRIPSRSLASAGRAVAIRAPATGPGGGGRRPAQHRRDEAAAARRPTFGDYREMYDKWASPSTRGRGDT